MTFPEGIQKTILTEGTGPTPSAFNKVYVNYEGFLEDNTKFDSTQNTDPFSFTLQKGQVIKGWEIGIASMKKGEKAKFILQPEYAYGENGNPPAIPENACLRFVVELIDFENKPESPKEQIELCLELKKRASEVLSDSKDYKTAKWLYTRSFDAIRDTWEATDSEMAEISDLKVNLNSNLALCNLKLENYKQAIENTSEVLQKYPGNSKCLFRRGVALKAIGHYDEAAEWLMRAVESNPVDAEIRRQLKEAQEMKRTSDLKLKAVYQNMFK